MNIKKNNKKRDWLRVDKPTTARLLAIIPGSRDIGLAVFEGAELLEYRVRTLRVRDEHAKLERLTRVIDKLFRRYQPEIIALKRLPPRLSSPTVDQITSEIRRLCLRRRLRVCPLSAHDISRRLSPGSCFPKQALADHVVASYPVLERELAIERASKRPYHLRMFEAVALGMACRRPKMGSTTRTSRPQGYRQPQEPAGVWLYLFLLLHANRGSGLLFHKINTICDATGLKRDSLLRWLRILRSHGYVTTRSTGRCLEIRITKWKPLRRAVNLQPQKYETRHIRGGTNPTGPRGLTSVGDHILSREIGRRPKRTK